jgi:hypothetical protein
MRNQAIQCEGKQCSERERKRKRKRKRKRNTVHWTALYSPLDRPGRVPYLSFCDVDKICTMLRCDMCPSGTNYVVRW